MRKVSCQSEIKTRPLARNRSRIFKRVGDGKIWLHIAASAALNEFLSSPLSSDEIIETMKEMRREI